MLSPTGGKINEIERDKNRKTRDKYMSRIEIKCCHPQEEKEKKR